MCDCMHERQGHNSSVICLVKVYITLILYRTEQTSVVSANQVANLTPVIKEQIAACQIVFQISEHHACLLGTVLCSLCIELPGYKLHYFVLYFAVSFLILFTITP